MSFFLFFLCVLSTGATGTFGHATTILNVFLEIRVFVYRFSLVTIRPDGNGYQMCVHAMKHMKRVLLPTHFDVHRSIS